MVAESLGTLAWHACRCIGQDNDEFIAAVAAGNVLPTHTSQKQPAQFAQDRIARGMAPHVVARLKSSTADMRMPSESSLREARSNSRSRVFSIQRRLNKPVR